MDATCTIQDSIHVFNLVHKYVSRILGTYHTPGVGTFYDFINRLWNSDDDHMSPHIHPLKTRVKKPKTKGMKADSVEKVTVAELLPSLENTFFFCSQQNHLSKLLLLIKMVLLLALPHSFTK